LFGDFASLQAAKLTDGVGKLPCQYYKDCVRWDGPTGVLHVANLRSIAKGFSGGLLPFLESPDDFVLLAKALYLPTTDYGDVGGKDDGSVVAAIPMWVQTALVKPLDCLYRKTHATGTLWHRMVQLSFGEVAVAAGHLVRRWPELATALDAENRIALDLASIKVRERIDRELRFSGKRITLKIEGGDGGLSDEDRKRRRRQAASRRAEWIQQGDLNDEESVSETRRKELEKAKRELQEVKAKARAGVLRRWHTAVKWIIAANAAKRDAARTEDKVMQSKLALARLQGVVHQLEQDRLAQQEKDDEESVAAVQALEDELQRVREDHKARIAELRKEERRAAELEAAADAERKAAEARAEFARLEKEHAEEQQALEARLAAEQEERKQTELDLEQKLADLAGSAAAETEQWKEQLDALQAEAAQKERDAKLAAEAEREQIAINLAERKVLCMKQYTTELAKQTAAVKRAAQFDNMQISIDKITFVAGQRQLGQGVRSLYQHDALVLSNMHIVTRILSYKFYILPFL
jgi:hypothetical protein